MVLIDAEFEKIALATNRSIAANRAKYDQEIAAAKAAADAKAIADAKDADAKTAAKAATAVANAKTPEDSEFDRLTKEIVKATQDGLHRMLGNI